MTHARVIGAGISGLTTAWRLADQGLHVEIFDAATTPGGLIRSTETPWGLAEHAANAFVWNDTVAAWFRRLQLTPVFALDSSKRRYLYRDGKARRWPLTPAETLTTLACAGRAIVTRAMPPRGTETVEQWGHRVMGRAAARHLLAPALQGIYAAPLDQLSAEAVFGHRRKRSSAMAVPAGGMGQFVSALVAALESRGVRLHLGRPVTTLDAGTPTWVCTNAPAAAALLRPHAPEASHAVEAVRLAALASVTTFYEPHARDLHGFGVLFPRDSGIQALGVLFNTDIFPGRGACRSETWIYGSVSTGGLPTQTALPALVAADREQLTGRSQVPLGTHTAYWPRAFPIYDQAIVRLNALAERLPPWLHVAGNYLGRRGVSDLVAQPPGVS